MIINFKQQLMGTLNITFYVFVMYALLGDFVISNLWWRLGVSFLLGLYIAFIQYGATKALANNLQFEPEGPYKDILCTSIRECNLDPATIRLRYGYSQGSIALTIENTISIDPMVWKESAEHNSIQKARENINTYISPKISQGQKELDNFIKEHMTPDCQNFIFKHELGHITNHYSIKKIVLTGCVMATAVFLGTTLVWLLMPYVGGLASAFIGAIIGSATDILLSSTTNIFFKYNQEKEADRFAIRYSTPKEMEAAAQFFERHQAFYDKIMAEQDRFYAATKYLSGNLDGKERAILLKAHIQQNSIS
jgi:hypothetical protein